MQQADIIKLKRLLEEYREALLPNLEHLGIPAEAYIDGLVEYIEADLEENQP